MIEQFWQNLSADQIIHLKLAVGLLIALVAITLHEAGHAYAAKWLGDDTAERLGRASLRPWRHMDAIGTVLLPGLLLYHNLPAFGWAKPVPVQFNRLRNPRWGTLLVALAGPAMNLIQALIAAAILWAGRAAGWIGDLQDPVVLVLSIVIMLNMILIFFNMLPLPPLDGSRVLNAIFPGLGPVFHKLERIGVFGVLLLFIALPLLTNRLVDPGRWLVFGPAIAIADGIELITRPGPLPPLETLIRRE